MKERREFGGRFQRRLIFSTDEIDEICQEALLKSGYLPARPQAIRIDRFVEKYFQCNAGYEKLPDGILGYTLFDNRGKVLEVRVSEGLEDGRQTSERRVRSTWAHEGGHCLLHGTLFIEESGSLHFGKDEGKELGAEERRILCRDKDIRPVGNALYGGEWWEWQANRCIGGLLLPKALLIEAVLDLLTESLVTRAPILLPAKRQIAEKRLSEIFEVNPIVARIRLSEVYPDSKGQIEF